MSVNIASEKLPNKSRALYVTMWSWYMYMSCLCLVLEREETNMKRLLESTQKTCFKLSTGKKLSLFKQIKHILAHLHSIPVSASQACPSLSSLFPLKKQTCGIYYKALGMWGRRRGREWGEWAVMWGILEQRERESIYAIVLEVWCV